MINESQKILYHLGPNIHWTSNYGTGIVFIGNMLSCLSFHNLIFQLFLQISEICFQKAIVQYITFNTVALYLKKI